jgi:hypothetical protein
MVHRKVCDRKRLSSNFKTISWNLPEGGLRKNTKSVSQDSRSPDRDLNAIPPEYEAVVVTTRPRLFILYQDYKLLKIIDSSVTEYFPSFV